MALACIHNISWSKPNEKKSSEAGITVYTKIASTGIQMFDSLLNLTILFKYS